MSLFEKIAELQKADVLAAVCTVVDVRGSTPRKVGTKMVVIDNTEPLGGIIGTIGGGAIEHHIRKKALEALRGNRSQLVITSLRNDLGMCCGGQMTVFIEPIAKSKKLIMFGAGHIAQALCPLAHTLGYHVSVVDERLELLAKDEFSIAKNRFNNASNFSLNEMPFGSDTFVVIATHDHDLDQQIVESVLLKSFKYCALVGSKRKALMTQKRLMAKGFKDEDIKKLICPAGIDILASTPHEIAVSIVAQMTFKKNETAKN